MIDSKTPKTYDKFRNPDSLFHKDKYEKIFGVIGKKRSWNVLEIGCGTGIYTKFLKNDFDYVTAFDIDPAMINICKGKPEIKNVSLCVGDSLEIPIKSNSVDFVMGVSVLHHVSNRSGIFAEVRRVLKSGGYFVFLEPNKLNIFTLVFQLLQKEDAISRFEIKKMIEENKLSVVAIKEILFRGPGIGDTIRRKFKFYLRVENFFEKLHLGVTLLAIGKKEA